MGGTVTGGGRGVGVRGLGAGGRGGGHQQKGFSLPSLTSATDKIPAKQGCELNTTRQLLDACSTTIGTRWLQLGLRLWCYCKGLRWSI